MVLVVTSANGAVVAQAGGTAPAGPSRSQEHHCAGASSPQASGRGPEQSAQGGPAGDCYLLTDDGVQRRDEGMRNCRDE